MKTTLFLLLFMTVVMVKGSYGQSPSDTYIIGISMDTKSNGNQSGLLKNILQKNVRDLTDPIIFRINSEEKGYSIPLDHFNTARRPRRIVTMEASKLGSLNAIYAHDFIQDKTKEQADEWGKAHINKTIWVIDRNDFYWEGAKQYMKLIETTIDPMTYPEPPIFEYIEVEK